MNRRSFDQAGPTRARKRWLPVAAAAGLAIATAARADGGAGLRVERDPATGELVAPLKPSASAAPAAAPASSRGLVERRGTTSGGGVLVDLEGRFDSSVSVRGDATGDADVRCQPTTAAARPAGSTP